MGLVLAYSMALLRDRISFISNCDSMTCAAWITAKQISGLEFLTHARAALILLKLANEASTGTSTIFWNVFKLVDLNRTWLCSWNTHTKRNSCCSMFSGWNPSKASLPAPRVLSAYTANIPNAPSLLSARYSDGSPWKVEKPSFPLMYVCIVRIH